MIELINSSAETWFRMMTSATLQAALLALIALSAVWLFRRRSPAWCHALLMIALLKFAVPPSLSLPSGLFSQLKPEPSAQALRSVPYVAPLAPIVDEVLWPAEGLPAPAFRRSTADDVVSSTHAAAPVPSKPVRPKPTLKGWLMLVHLAGALLFIGVVILEKLRLRRLADQAEPATDEGLLFLFDELCGKIRLPRKPALLLSQANHSPMTFGAWKPVVLLPRALIDVMHPEELVVILGHELAHQRRRDLWLSWLQVPISAVWWFNPIYWFLSRKIRSVREDCCDDLVVASGLASGEAYCETLLQAARVASGCALTGAALAYINESHPLRRRLQRIMTSKLITAPRLAWTGIITVILLALFFLPGIRKRTNEQTPSSSTEAQNSALPASDLPNPLPTAAGAQNFPTLPLLNGIPVTEIQVRVVEKVTGRPVANAALLLAAAMAVKDMVLAEAPHTDSDGRCTIAAPKAPTWLTVRAEGFVPRHLRLSAMETMPLEYVFKMDKGSTIGGYVQDEEGKPLENVKLSIYSSNAMFDLKQKPQDLEAADNWVYTQTDRSGRWTVTEVVPDPERIQLTLDHPERISVQLDTVASIAPPVAGVFLPENVAMSDLREGKAVLVMKSGLMVSGKVMDETGRGIAGGDIIASDSGSRGMSAWMLDSPRTDANGQFALRVAKAGEISIYVQAKSFAPEERAVKVVPGLPPVEFRLKKGEIVSGRVIDESGNPIPNATLRTGNALPSRIAPFSWSSKTDDYGRFVWDSAPLRPLSYTVSATGYDAVTSLVLEPAREHEIRLTKGSELIITGKVTDAKTKMPIDAFTVSLSSSTIALRPVAGKGGEFTLTLPVRTTQATVGGRAISPPTYGILVEAEGYLPDLSRSVEAKPGNLYAEISLVRGNGLTGIVLLPNGSPAPNAGVFLCGGSGTPPNLPSGAYVTVPGPSMSSNIKSIRCAGSTTSSPFAAATETDDSGRFTLKAVAQAHSFYAVHEKGFVALSAESLPAAGNIPLQPWGRIVGVVMVGSKPAANQSLSLSSLSLTQQPPALRVMLTASTDGEGKNEFASVPPGEYRVSHRPATGSGGNSAIVVVRSGETAAIRIGGTGRPLTGRIVVTGSDPNAPPKIQSASLSLKLPEENIPSPADGAAYRQWMESEAALARSRAQRSYTLRPDADGSFRLEDVPAGTYTLTVMASSSGLPSPLPGMTGIERFSRDIVVPEMPGGRSDELLNLGVIPWQLPPKK